eukprot:TRINITY_DN52800_c0_g1_i1.p1 TRINITY_DN52800_c0_g1~~TRINITY_DN52800_c0_g1_i1.p1  ORF type:complete len:1465 (-),score=323.77 TRINITY_DN52800_c0_g1_i1:648-5042(-)
MSKRVDDRGGTATATKVEGTTLGYPTRMVAGLPTDQLPNTPLPPNQGGVTVTGPGLVVSNSSPFPRVLTHGGVVYREGTTITPAPAHAAQPNTVIHQQLAVTQPSANIKPEPIGLPQTPVTVQYSSFPKSIVSAPTSITVAVTTPGGPVVHNMQLHQPSGHIVQKVAHGALAFGGQQNVRSVAANNMGGMGGGGTANQPPSFQRLKVEDALSYLDQVKFKFGNQPQVYNDFLDIMKEFKSQSIDTPGVISRVSMLFKGHPELIVGFNTFLPPGYKIEVQTNETSQHQNMPGHPHLQSLFQTIVHTPHGTHMMGNHGIMGPVIPTTSLQSLSSPVSVRPVTVHQPPKYSVKTVPEPLAHSPNPNPPQAQPPRIENQQVYAASPNPIMQLPPPTLSISNSPHINSGTPPTVNILNSINPNTLPTPPNQGPNNQPVEFNHAINYVNKIKNRFQGQPDVYKQFLEILHTYQKDQRAIKEGGAPKSLLTESEVYAQVSKLFQNQEDLLSEFGQFLPEATNDHSTAAIMVSSKGLANDHVPATANTKRPNKHNQPNSIIPSKIEPRPPPENTNLKRPLQPGRMQPPAKKPRIGVLKDVSLGEAGRYGTLNEFAFFDKVRKALKNGEVYENFLRCLVLFNQEIVSRPELVQLVTPFLNKHPELLKWFKDFVGFRDGSAGPGGAATDQVLPAVDPQRARQERVSGDAAMEIDYASCKRLGASYCALPKNFVQPKCSGRSAGSICKEVLNDTWVSFPSWSEDSQFVSSRKTQYEEHIYRTEDERFEFDVVLETNRDTIKVLECVQKKMGRMPPEEAARYRLDDCLGGTSPTIHQRAIRRIYGDKSADIIDGLKRNPVVAVPLVLRRLKAKDSEWREVQKQFNKVWREQNEKYYLKSLDHQGMIFKQNDIRAIRSKSLLNEIETLYDEQHEQIEQNGGTVVTGVPHLTLQYRDKAVLDDAALLLIHHVKRQTSIHKEDKQKIKVLLKQSLPDMFFHTRQEMSDTESEKESDSEKDESDNEESKNKKKETKEILVKEEDVLAEIKEGDIPQHAKSVEHSESYSLLMANNHWYLFLRLHNTLCERLATMYDHALVIAAEEGEESNGRKENTATALRLKPKNGLSPNNYYPAFKDMVMSVLDGNMDSMAFEDTLREMFGIHAFTAFTLDKVIANCVRQLQHLVTDESCTECWDLHLSEKRVGGTGGEVATADKRYFNELLYQKKSEKILADENCFKIVLYRDRGTMTVELLDTETESRNGSENEEEEEGKDEKQQQLEAYVARFLGPGEPMTLSPCTVSHLARKPVFLSRSVRSYRAKTRHKIVPRQIPEPTPAEGGEPKEETNTNRPGLGRHDKLNLSDSAIMWEESDNSSCVINTDYKILWVVNSENYIYKRNALNRAKETHPAVCVRKYKNWCTWHGAWAAQHVTEAQQTKHNEWMLGRVEGLRPNKTHRLTFSDLNKAPYRTFTKFKVGEVSS